MSRQIQTAQRLPEPSIAPVDELGQFTAHAIGTVIADLGRARTLVQDAASKLMATFCDLRDQLALEREQYEQAIHAITGAGDDRLVHALREIMRRFVDDIVQIGKSSVQILLEIEVLRRHADQVAGHGHNIERIANVTRMISLNARIEAQRSGASGAVFQVVADEIKGLANESRELSRQIREAIALQAAALAETASAASNMSAIDLNATVESYKRLEVTIERLEVVSAKSTLALDRIKTTIDGAIQALQFQDMLDQLLVMIVGKLATIRAVCLSVDGGEDLATKLQVAEREIDREPVTQQDVNTGSVELF